MSKYLHPVTPAEIAAPLKALCDEIAPESTATYVDVRPVSSALRNECFVVVEAQVTTAGGSAVIGWTLWEMPGVFVEAEFHAVWSPNGTDLLDLTPKPAPVARILFLPDPTRKYEGRQVSNLRRPVRQDPAVQGYLDTFFEEFELKNRGERAFQHGELDLNTEELKQLAEILGRRQTFGREMNIPDVWAYGPCPCSSGKKTKWCHKNYL